MKLLYLTQWFEPEPAFKGAAFARALADAGIDVEVATGFPNYPGGNLYPGYRIRPYQRETIDGITVHRLPLVPSHDGSSLGRIANYLSFWASALVFGLWRGGRYDAVYVYHPPLTPALAAAAFCAVHRRPMLVEIQDLWPDSVAASGMANKNIITLLNKACNFIYRRAALVIAQSNGMRAELERRGVPPERLETLFNWATYEPADGVEALPENITRSFNGRFNLIYGGNIGQAQNLEVVIRAAQAAHVAHPKLRLHLIGGGIERDKLILLTSQLDATDYVHFHDTVQRRTMDRVFDAADALIMHLADDPLYDITIPSKTQHYLASAKPIIAGVSGEPASILTASGAALVVPPGNVAAMAEAMQLLLAKTDAERREMGKMGRIAYDAQYSFETAIRRTVELISRVIDSGVRRSGK